MPGLYCVGCEAFKSEDELVDGKCPEHGDRVEYIEEKNYFFRLSAYEDRLLALYDERPDFVLPDFRYNEARSFIAGGLQDFSISRAGQTWGIPLPWDESQVAYVWADALVNYLSALSYARPGEDLVPVYWPAPGTCSRRTSSAFTACTGRRCSCRPATRCHSSSSSTAGCSWKTRRSRSRSGTSSIRSPLVDVYGSDAVRYWAIRAASFGRDGSVSEESLHERYERELANELGNLVSRTTAMIARYRDGELSAGPGSPEVAAKLDALHAEIPAWLDAWDLTGALESIWDVVRELNRLVERAKPWELAKDEAQGGRARHACSTTLQTACGPSRSRSTRICR